MKDRLKILFVCHGNICRSPMAESYFTWLVRDQGLSDRFLIASAATRTDEIGNPPHYGTREKLAREGIPLVPHRARLLTRADGDAFDFIFGMDEENMRDMRRILGACPARVALLLGETLHPRAIADPWYTGNFDETFSDIAEGCRAFLASLQPKGIV